MSAYLEVVADWLRTQVEDVATVTSAAARGSEWGGSTETGFYDTVDITIKYVTTDGSEKHYSVDGSEVAALWNYVIGVKVNQFGGVIEAAP